MIGPGRSDGGFGCGCGAIFGSLLLVAALGYAGYLFVWNTFFNKPVDLSEAEVSDVKLGLRDRRGSICPRQPVQLKISAKVVVEGKTKKLETWAAGDDDKLDNLGFADFDLDAKLGRIDDEGWFHPESDLLASAGETFVIRARHGDQRAELKAKPAYDCIVSAGFRGEDGRAGGDGSNGMPEVQGSPGQTGGLGGAGPRLQAFVSYVKTPHYDKLMAVSIEGDRHDLVLAPPDATLTLFASGGRGGSGGDGGDGGNARGRDDGPFRAGAAGGPGGNGGPGGPGGDLTVVVDARFGELKQHLRLDASGGRGGDAGNGGYGGRGRGRGSRRGIQGSSGVQGPDGSAGRTRIELGEVGKRFTSLGAAVQTL